MVYFICGEIMIKNIVFDLGNVLVTFDPKSFLKDLIHNKKIEEDLYSFYFHSDLWILYDQGSYSNEDMIQKGIQIYPQYEKYIRSVIERWVEYVIPIVDNIQLLDLYTNYSLYIISDIPQYNYDYLNEHYSFLKKVNGGIYSYQEKVCKPNKKMFTRLLEKYKINPQECVFIDDKYENIKTALDLGFKGIHLKDPKDLKKKLEEVLYEM